MALAAEQVGKCELAHLRGGRLRQLFVAPAERGTPEPRHAIDVWLAGRVVEMDALPALDDERTGLAKAREVGVGMDQRFDVAGGEIARHDAMVGQFWIERNRSPRVMAAKAGIQ